jgi:hypothetical protein
MSPGMIQADMHRCWSKGSTLAGYLVHFSVVLITIQTSQSRQYLENTASDEPQAGSDGWVIERLVERTNTTPESAVQEDLLPPAGLSSRQPTPGQVRPHSSTDRCVCLSSLEMRNRVQPFTNATAAALLSRWTPSPLLLPTYPFTLLR